MSEQDAATLDKQLRALAQLRTLKALLEEPKAPAFVSSQLAETYAAALDHLAEIGEDVEEFRFRGRSRGMGALGAVVDRDPLRVNVVAVLEYFTIRAAVLETARQMHQKPSRMIGFEPSNQE